MTSLQSISELLKSGKIADGAQRVRLLDLMAGECNRLGRYLTNVLDFGRIERDAKRYEIRRTDLKPVVADVVEIVRWAVADEGLDLAVDLPDGPVRVMADPDAVRQARQPGGQRQMRREKEMVAPDSRDGTAPDLVDNGIGIPAPTRPDLELIAPRGRPPRSEGRRPGLDRQARRTPTAEPSKSASPAGAAFTRSSPKAGIMKIPSSTMTGSCGRRRGGPGREGYRVAEAADGRRA
jgi:hypothetical protein